MAAMVFEGDAPVHLTLVPFLSPAKLLVILVVALVVLGPDKLPRVAKQIGGLWGDFRKFRERLEADVRGSFPDLPSSDKIAQAVRSPLSFLDDLAASDSNENDAIGTTSVTVVGSESTAEHDGDVQSAPVANRPAGVVHASASTVSIAVPGGVSHEVREAAAVVADDPGMN
jgi:TatA/E family protein of Tat protein translocase